MSMRIAGVLALAALAGCSTDEGRDPLQAFCNGFGMGATVQFTSCASCTAVNPGNAGDGNLSTETSIVPSSGATTETFVLEATSVSNIAGGTIVGAWVTQPSTITNFTTNFETFLDGNPDPVETLDAGPNGNGVVIVADEGTPAGGFIGMRTTQAFDKVRMTRTNQWSAGADPVYRVYEICSDGGAL